MNHGNGRDWLMWVISHAVVCGVFVLLLLLWDAVTGDFEGAEE